MCTELQLSPSLLCRMKRYLASSREEAANNIPLLFVTSPSAKDPTWEMRYPGKTDTQPQMLVRGFKALVGVW